MNYEYHCRRCRRDHVSLASVPRDVAAAWMIDRKATGPHQQQAPLEALIPVIDLHECADGGLGIADLVGASPEKPPRAASLFEAITSR